MQQILFHHLHLVFTTLQEEFPRWKEHRTHKDFEKFPCSCVMGRLSEHLHIIERISRVPAFEQELLHKTFMFGRSSGVERTIQDFLTDIIHFLGCYEDSMKFVRILLEYNPESFNGWCELGYLLDDVDEEGYLRALQSTITVGEKQGKDVERYKYRLRERERPARDPYHAMTIAYHLHRVQLKKRFPKAYICCDGRSEIQMLMGGVLADLPPNEIIQIDGFEVVVRFSTDRVTLL